MVQMIEANWIAVAAVLALVLLVAWSVWGRAKPSRARRDYNDVLSEGAGPAQRNTALIDAAPAAAIPPIVPGPASGLMAGVGEIVAHAAEEEIEATQDVVAPIVAPVSGDDLTRIKGVGPKLNARLKELGVTSYAQIAAWSETDLAAIDAQLGSFAGRPLRDSWIEQAQLLSGGDTAGYEAKFGKL